MLKKIIIGGSLAVVIVAGLTAGIFALLAPSDEAQNVEPPTAPNVASQSSPLTPDPATQAMGDPWQATGTITGVDDFGLTLNTDEGNEVYVELGPPDYWQAQGISLEADQTVTVTGFANDDQIHAVQVQLADGQTLMLRTVEGQPLWSGGANNGNANGQADGTHSPDPQVQVEEWVTVNGTITAMRGANITVVTDADEAITFQAGQPRFFADQGVSFAMGDAVEVLGFWQDEKFIAGQITKTDTNEFVMLRDPNGRPLWAGPGNGNGNGGQ